MVGWPVPATLPKSRSGADSVWLRLVVRHKVNHAPQGADQVVIVNGAPVSGGGDANLVLATPARN
jgi:hypothetical protein